MGVSIIPGLTLLMRPPRLPHSTAVRWTSRCTPRLATPYAAPESSIISPATANGVAGLRPTYGRVSRHGAMALSWTMDKIGPMCRTVEDCALVFNAIYGPDGHDDTVVDAPFKWNPEAPLAGLKVAYVKREFEEIPATMNEENLR